MEKQSCLTNVRDRLSDYGFAWTPHGTYARDLSHFKNLLGFTPHEAIIAASYGVAKLFMQSHEMGQIQKGNYADCTIVDGDPLQDLGVLQDHAKLNVIIINGRVHKAGRKEYIFPAVTADVETRVEGAQRTVPIVGVCT